jgi:hypothetical protein
MTPNGFTPPLPGKNTGTYLRRGCVGPGAGMDVLEKSKTLVHIYPAYSIISVV